MIGISTNILYLDLRQLCNHKLWDLSKIVSVQSEVTARGFRDIFELAKEPATYYGVYATKEEYLATFPAPLDIRIENGGC